MAATKKKVEKPNDLVPAGVKLRRETKEALKKIADAEDRPYGRVVQRACSEYVKNHERAQS